MQAEEREKLEKKAKKEADKKLSRKENAPVAPSPMLGNVGFVAGLKTPAKPTVSRVGIEAPKVAATPSKTPGKAQTVSKLPSVTPGKSNSKKRPSTDGKTPNSKVRNSFSRCTKDTSNTSCQLVASKARTIGLINKHHQRCAYGVDLSVLDNKSQSVNVCVIHLLYKMLRCALLIRSLPLFESFLNKQPSKF